MYFNVNTKAIGYRHQQYIESDDWKCSRSPTGAHHWLVKGRRMKCKYCRKVRNLDEKGLVIVNDNQELQLK